MSLVSQDSASVHQCGFLPQVVLAFRGTQSTNGFDWWTDALVLQAKTAKDPVTGGLRTVGDLGDGAVADGGKGIHTGFYRAYRSALLHTLQSATHLPSRVSPANLVPRIITSLLFPVV